MWPERSWEFRQSPDDGGDFLGGVGFLSGATNSRRGGLQKKRAPEEAGPVSAVVGPKGSERIYRKIQ